MQTSLLTFTDSVGIVAFALSGLFAVKGKKIDPVGVFVTAFGGGIVRDLVIGNRPMYWIANQEYVWATLALSFFAESGQKIHLYAHRQEANHRFKRL